jgi:hypothetical protein
MIAWYLICQARMNVYGHMLFLQPKAATTFLYALRDEFHPGMARVT